MDGSNPGEIGVIAWCNSFRFQLAKDPGRQFMHDQIKNKGFDFLDTYLEDTLARPTEGRIYDIMKTPGRKRDAPKRTRAATAAASKVKTVIADSLSERKEKENVAPVNDFHKALLDAKSTNDELVEDAPVAKSKQKKPPPPAPQQDEVDDRESAPTPRPVPVVKDAPVKPKSPSPAHEDMEIEEPEPAPIELAQPEPAVAATIPTIITPEVPAHSQSQDTLQELSMIVEENDERSRMSLKQTVDEYNSDSDADMETEMMVPIKDEDATTTTILNRKPSISQFGLPAPSPLKKSTRGPREPSVPPPPSQTPGTAMNNKRTSWLTKAKEAKAFEMTGSGKKKAAAVGLGIATAVGSSATRKRKSEEMEDVAITPSSSEVTISQDERKVKSARTSREEDVKSSHSSDRGETHSSREETGRISHSRTPSEATSHHDGDEFTIAVKLDSPAEGALDRFRKTMDGGRVGRSMGKSLGGAAAAALAEARAAAEARVAQRNKEVTVDTNAEPSSSSTKSSEKVEAPPVAIVEEKAPSPPVAEKVTPVPVTTGHRLSLSDLVPSSAKLPPSAQPIASSSPPSNDVDNASMSTTPPNSPPPAPPAPVEIKPSVFSKPVFTAPPKDQPPPLELPAAPAPPTAGVSKAFSFKLPGTTVFSRPIATTLGVPAALSTSGSKPAPVSSQPSQASVFSDAIFDKEDDIPAWVPSTQDTDFSIQPSQSKSHQEQLDELENEDPIWPMEDKFASNNIWTPYGFASSGDRDDTGSTFDTAEDGIQTTQSFRDALQRAAMEQADTMDVHGVIESAQTQSENEDGDVAMNVDTDGVDSELEDILRTGQSTISLVPSKPPSNRSESQQSMASGSSSQSQLGFFGQASKFVSSYLGKKKGEPVKSIQLAAAAAKKQQQEADKKANRLKDMEARRQQAMQRKADEEKARAVEEERKIKEDVERRKREREEHTDKRPLRSTKQAEDDTTKKRKITVETQKKPDTQKPPSRDQPSRLAKPTAATTPATKTKTMKSIMKQPSSSQLSSTTPATKEAPRQIKPMSSTTSLKSALKGKGKAQPLDEDMQQPSQQLQSQMVYRAQAHMKATEPRAPPKVAPESIELPEVHSDYEYSDDEPRQDAFEPPEWAQSPELREALKQQSSMNPDAIFGPIQPFRMEELFAAAARQPRLKVRSSSANWGVAGDGLTQEEERDYARRMGFD